MKQIVKSKFLEVLPSDVPYKISPVIQTWSMDNGVLRLGVTVIKHFANTVVPNSVSGDHKLLIGWETFH